MLSVFSVILEYRMDGRNSSDRPKVRPQSLYCMCILHSRHLKATPNTFIFIHLIVCEFGIFARRAMVDQAREGLCYQ